METTTLNRWGNSQGIRIPKVVVEQLALTDNQKLTVSVENNQIILTPQFDSPKTLRELIGDYDVDKDGKDTELDWGEPVGKEIW